MYKHSLPVVKIYVLAHSSALKKREEKRKHSYLLSCRMKCLSGKYYTFYGTVKYTYSMALSQRVEFLAVP